MVQRSKKKRKSEFQEFHKVMRNDDKSVCKTLKIKN